VEGSPLLVPSGTLQSGYYPNRCVALRRCENQGLFRVEMPTLFDRHSFCEPVYFGDSQVEVFEAALLGERFTGYQRVKPPKSQFIGHSCLICAVRYATERRQAWNKQAQT